MKSDNGDVKNLFCELYKQNQEKLQDNSTPFLNNVRDSAFKTFETLGLPTKKEEKYKYTSLEPIFLKTFNYHFRPQNIEFNLKDIFSCDVPEIDPEAIVLLNGFYSEKFNTKRDFPKGVIVSSFSDAAKTHPDIVNQHFSKYAGFDGDGVVALNTAFVKDGIFFYVPKNVIVEKPIQIVNLLLSQEEILVQHRNLFVFEDNTQADIVINDHTLSPHTYLTNSVTEVYAGKNAQFNLTRIQNEHNGSTQVTNTFIHQMADSKVTSNTITLHGGFVRNNINVLLSEPGAENSTYGLHLLDHGQHVDNYVNIKHMAPHCTSTQLFKGVLDDYSVGAFNGTIYVDRKAQKTMAYQTSRNLLLTDDARMYTKPQLEIYADDVKCSHGATVGQLDEDAMFYMRARGIPKDQARLLMMYAFADEITSKITLESLKERVQELVHRRLRGELSRCNNCSMICC